MILDIGISFTSDLPKLKFEPWCLERHKAHIKEAKSAYYNKWTTQARNLAKELFCIFEELQFPTSLAPDSPSSERFCQNIAEFFQNKIWTVRDTRTSEKNLNLE